MADKVEVKSLDDLENDLAELPPNPDPGDVAVVKGVLKARKDGSWVDADLADLANLVTETADAVNFSVGHLKRKIKALEDKMEGLERTEPDQSRALNRLRDAIIDLAAKLDACGVVGIPTTLQESVEQKVSK